MSQTSAPKIRTFAHPISANPAAISVPSDIAPIEVWLYSTSAFSVRGVNDIVDFPYEASIPHRLPLNTVSNMRITNPAQVIVQIFGN